MDRLHSDPEEIHRVTTVDRVDGMHYATAPRPLATTLRGTEAGLTAVAPVNRYGDCFVVRDESSLTVDVIHTHEAFWAVFDGFQFLAGTKASALSRPRTAVLSRETARQLYGAETPVGKTLRHEGQTE